MNVVTSVESTIECMGLFFCNHENSHCLVTGQNDTIPILKNFSYSNSVDRWRGQLKFAPKPKSDGLQILLTSEWRELLRV
jgi:hypothetical protein